MLYPRTRYRQTTITCPQDIYTLILPILLRKSPIDRTREHLWVIGLDNGNNIIYIEQVSVGCIDSVIAHPMEIFCMAVRKRCVSIVLIHNHSVSPEPSRADKLLTTKIAQAGELLNIKLLDHLIITTEEYYSFASEDQLALIAREPISRKCNNLQHPLPGFLRYFITNPVIRLMTFGDQMEKIGA